MSFDSLSEWIRESWWPIVQSATVASTLVMLVVAVVWLGIRRRASAHLGYAMFLLPLIPFVLPLRGALPWEVQVGWLAAGSSLETRTQSSPSAERTESNSVRKESAPAVQLSSNNWPLEPFSAPARTGSDRVTTPSVNAVESTPASSALVLGDWLAFGLFGLWASVVLWLATRWARWQLRTQRLARRAPCVRDPRLKQLLRITAKRAGLLRVPRLVESSRVQAPAVCGIWRPTVLLPVGIGELFDDEALAWSLHHEFAHLRRRDLLVASFQRAIAVLWWFHPLVWIANRQIAELRECACDEAALARMPQLSRRRAANALVDLIESARHSGSEALALESLYSHKQSLEKRIMRLIDQRYKSRRGLTPLACVFLMAMAGVSFASSQLVLRGSEPTSEPAEALWVAEPSHSRIEPPASEEAVASLMQEPPAERVEEVEEIEPVDEIEEIEELEPAPDRAAHAAVSLARQWLVDEQREDGRWETGYPRKNQAGEFSEAGITALAIDCLLGSDRPDHQRAVQRGLTWLEQAQDSESGLFGQQVGWGFMSGHAAATRTWIRAHGAKPDKAQREVAQQAVNFIFRSRNPYAAWRFESPPIGDNDTFVTSLMLRALAEGRRIGLKMDQEALRDGMAYLDGVTDTNTGRTGYDSLGGPPARLAGKAEDFPVKYSEYPTAMAIMARLDLGQDPVDSHTIIAGGGLIARLSPEWNPVKGKNDAYYWLYGTEALRQLGGVGWKRWRRDLLEALVPHQRTSGSWPLMDAWSSSNDRVHLTAVYTLALIEALKE